jgi:hypothetical protein
VFVPRYTRDEASAAVRASFNYSEVLRRLGLRPAGGNHRTLRHWVDDVWQIPTGHFDPDRAIRGPQREATPLDDVLVEHSPYSRAALKRRLFATGLKQRRCELCGQGEAWHGGVMALILDHVNGVPDDNRLENLRIVCPNCNATLETHCGRHNRKAVTPRECLSCGGSYEPRFRAQRYCSRRCGIASPAHAANDPARRKAVRPPFEQLMAELQETSYSAVGRKYGVTDNAVRTWVRRYRSDLARREENDAGEGD